jgi:tRNA threonylcarbamoyladenosine biosynthesis protein TsaB
MSHILILETSGESCSVALTDNDELIYSKEINETNSHASHLTNLISNALNQAELDFNKIDAVAVNGGPGSYTGLRVGISVAKGMCFSLSIPLVAVDGLKCLASAAIQKHQNKFSVYCAIMNSRLNELYCSSYKNDNSCILNPAAVILDDDFIQDLDQHSSVCFAGSGYEKIKPFILNYKNFYVDYEIIMSAKVLSKEAFSKYENNVFESLVDFEPFYLKPVHIRKKLE